MPSGPRTRSREPVALALAAGATIDEAAKIGGVSPRTVAGWLAEDGFRRRVRELQDRAVSRALAKLADTMTSAADVLRDLLADEDPAVRFRAAAKILDIGIQAHAVESLKRRLEEVERAGASGAGDASATPGDCEPEEFDLDGECEPSGDLPERPGPVDG